MTVQLIAAALLLAAAQPAAAKAPAPTRFDSQCHAEFENGDTMDVRFRIDLETMRYCRDACRKVFPVARNRDLLLLQDPPWRFVVPASGASSDPEMHVRELLLGRPTWPFVAHWNAVLRSPDPRFLGLVYRRGSGVCAPARFSGIPSEKKPRRRLRFRHFHPSFSRE